MKILVITQYYYPERFKINDICEELVKKGYEVTVITGLPNYPQGKIYKGYRFLRKRNEIINGVEVKRCFEISRGKSSLRLFLSFFSFWFSSRIKVLFLKKDYDVVFVFQQSPVMQIDAARIYKRRSNAKLVTYCQDIWPEVLKIRGIKETNFVFKFFHRLSKKLYKSSDLIIVSSNSFIEYLETVNDVKKEKMLYLPQHSDDDYLKVDFSKEPNNKIDLLYVGNIGKSQNIEMTIEALHKINNRNVYFHIVGDGMNFDNCKQLIEKYELNDNIVMYGQKDILEIPKFYKMCDACILTLSGKTLSGNTIPAKLQDYMAAGKTVIASINGEAKELIEQSNCGLCSIADDISLYKTNLFDFIENKDKYIDLGKNGKEYFKANFTRKQFIIKLEKIFKTK